MLKHLYRFSFALVFALSIFTFGQEDAAANAGEENAEGEQAKVNPWKPDIMQDGRLIQIGEYTIENPYKTRNSRLLHGDRYLQIWRYFMYAATDLRGFPIPWQALDCTSADVILDPAAIITLPYKKSNMPSIVVEGGKSVAIPKPVLDGDTIFAMRGDYIRVFIWIKAEDTGKDSDLYSGCPGFNLSLVDGTGAVVAKALPLFKTRGTFPWFCYHVDVKVPFSFAKAQAEEKKSESEGATEENTEATEGAENTENAEADNDAADAEAAIGAFAQQLIGITDESEEDVKALQPGLYVTLSNPASGKAWFSTLSWQMVKADETIFSQSAKFRALDPVTGSFAPNPDYDELPMHLFFGLSADKKWNFLAGTKALKPLIYKENLNECLEMAKHDWMYMLHAVPYLYSLYTNGMLLKTMSDFDKGWDETVLNFIGSTQQSTTGLWGVNDTPNLFITEAILKNTYSAQAPAYSDWTPQATPWKGSSKLKLAYADTIIDSIVHAQTFVQGRSAAWNNCSFNLDLTEANESTSTCDMPATAAAASILRYAAVSAGDEAVAKAQVALAQAWNYVMSSIIMRNGLWKGSSSSTSVGSQTSLFDFLDATPWLTFRTSDIMPAPQANLALDEKLNLTASWTPEAPAVALRIFVAGNDVKTENLNETHLVAIIQPPAKSYTAKEPLLLLRELVATGAKQWGVSPVVNGNGYILHKLQGIPKDLKVFTKLNGNKLKLKQGKRKQLIHYATVNAYGEMSNIVTIPESVPAAEGTEDEN